MTLPIFEQFSFTGKFDCICSINKTTFQIDISQKSVKIICISCSRVTFYRRVENI